MFTRDTVWFDALYAARRHAPPAALIFSSACFEKNLALTAMGCAGSLPLPSTCHPTFFSQHSIILSTLFTQSSQPICLVEPYTRSLVNISRYSRSDSDRLRGQLALAQHLTTSDASTAHVILWNLTTKIVFSAFHPLVDTLTQSTKPLVWQHWTPREDLPSRLSKVI